MKNLPQLISTINDVHAELQSSAANAVNKALTIRNWLIGYYIVEYEQNGEDRAVYGENIISNLAERLKHIRGLDVRSLRNIRQFYQYYSYLNGLILESVTQKLQNQMIRGSLTPELVALKDNHLKIELQQALPSGNQLLVPPSIILTKLSYTHLEALLKVSEPLKRTFYELECIKGTWSVRELKRQIASLYFERSGLSQDPEKLAELVQQKIQPQQPKDIIKN